MGDLLSDDQVQQLIDQVKASLPHLGEGYIDIALQCYENNVETTIAILLENEMDMLLYHDDDSPVSDSKLHPRLRNVHPSLPSLFTTTYKQSTNTHSLEPQQEEDKESMEAREIQKQRIRLMVQRERKEAAQLEMVLEMNHDTQHSDTVGTNDAPDREDDDNDETDDDDDDDDDDAIDEEEEEDDSSNNSQDLELLHHLNEYDAIRTYNRITREREADIAAWEASRNTNRIHRSTAGLPKDTTTHNHNKNTDEEVSDDGHRQTYRGPNKGKGGRVLGPDGRYLPRKSKPRTVVNGDVSTTTTDTTSTTNNVSGIPDTANTSTNSLSTQQKRRKNLNKARKANHNRRDRAARKTGVL